MNRILATVLLISIDSYAQQHRSELSLSKFFVIGHSEGKSYRFDSIAIRLIEKDTTIHNENFSKIKYQVGTDSKKLPTTIIQYENFKDDRYTLLDDQLRTIHDIEITASNSEGTIFYTHDSIQHEYVDTRTSFPRDSLKPDESTPVKYYLRNAPDKSLIIRKDLHIVELAANEPKIRKQLLGDFYTRMSRHWDEQKQILFHPRMKRGDQVQLVYRNKGYEKDGSPWFNYKQYKIFEFAGDTTVQGLSMMKFTINEFGYLSGAEKEPSITLLRTTDTSVDLDNYVMPFDTVINSFRVSGDSADNYFFIQAIDETHVGDTTMPVILQVFSNTPYRLVMPSFFLMPYFEVGNVEGMIPYVKINGRKYGELKEKVWLTDHTHVRKVAAANGQVEVTLFVAKPATVKFSVDNHQLLQKKLIAGEHVIRLLYKTKKDQEYTLGIDYRESENGGSQTFEFTGK